KPVRGLRSACEASQCAPAVPTHPGRAAQPDRWAGGHVHRRRRAAHSGPRRAMTTDYRGRSMATTTVTPARRPAHAVVRRALADGAFAARALHGEARDLDARDRALAKQLAFGTVQRRLTLDHVIDRHVDRELEPGVRAALQLGLFQLLFLDGVAPHAAIGEAVELAKPSPGHKLVNAVL